MAEKKKWRDGIFLIRRMILGKKKPPFILRWLCTATFVWSSFFLLLSLIFMLFGDMVTKGESFRDFKEAGATFFLIYSIINGATLFGAILMWRLKKTGFYLYAAGAAVGVILPFYMIDHIEFPQTELVVTGAFVLGYALHLGRMGTASPELEEE
jgi:hypothetical protein